MREKTNGVDQRDAGSNDRCELMKEKRVDAKREIMVLEVGVGVEQAKKKREREIRSEV